jgi:hypothetical protein
MPKTVLAKRGEIPAFTLQRPGISPRFACVELQIKIFASEQKTYRGEGHSSTVTGGGYCETIFISIFVR